MPRVQVESLPQFRPSEELILSADQPAPWLQSAPFEGQVLLGPETLPTYTSNPALVATLVGSGGHRDETV